MSEDEIFEAKKMAGKILKAMEDDFIFGSMLSTLAASPTSFDQKAMADLLEKFKNLPAIDRFISFSGKECELQAALLPLGVNYRNEKQIIEAQRALLDVPSLPLTVTPAGQSDDIPWVLKNHIKIIESNFVPDGYIFAVTESGKVYIVDTKTGIVTGGKITTDYKFRSE